MSTAAAMTMAPHLSPTRQYPSVADPADRFDPWIEVDRDALHFNVDTVARLTDGRPILAVVKNNAYGLGLTNAADLLEPIDAIWGFAVVTTDAAMTLRDHGVRKPVLLMGMTSESDAVELARRDVHLSVYTDDAPARIRHVAWATGSPPAVHLYFDTGLGRMGMPYHRAWAWLDALADVEPRIAGSFMAFTEEPDFDPEQIRRFGEVVETIRQAGLSPGLRHAASSNGVYHLPDAHLDLVRPGIALYGAYPSRPEEERRISPLACAVRLRTRVVRVTRLRAGDGVSYGRRYVAETPTWIATLPIGHADGYPREAVNGARVLIGDRLYPVIGAVSASHTIVELGESTAVQVGDIATLMGSDHAAIEPNALAAAAGVSVYDLLMHLNPELPRLIG